MLNPIAQTDRTSKPLRQVATDLFVIRQDVEQGRGIVRNAPAGIRDPMGSEINALLNRQKDVEARQVAALHVGEEVFRRPSRQRLGIVEPSRGPSHSTRGHS